MKRLAALISLCLLAAVPVAAQTNTPGPTATPFYCPTSSPAGAITYEEETLNLAPSSLRAYYPLNERAGLYAIDASGNGYHGTYAGVTLNAGTFLNADPAPSWDGVNDQLTIPASAMTTLNQGTVSMWLRVSTDLTNAEVDRWMAISLTSGGFLFIHDDGLSNTLSVRHFVGTSRIVSTSLTANTWTHVAATFDQTSGITVYVNGSAIAATASIGSSANAVGSIYVGSSGGSNYANGNFAHVSLWSTALSALEVAALSSVDTTPATPTPPPGCISGLPTATPTPNIYSVWTLAPGESESGQAVAFEYRVDAGSFINGLLLFIIALLLMAGLLMRRIN